MWYLSFSDWVWGSLTPSMLLQKALFHSFYGWVSSTVGLPWWLSGKESPATAGDSGSTPGSRRSSGEGNGTPLQYSCLGNLTDRGAWQAIQSVKLPRVRYDWATKQQNIHTHTHTHTPHLLYPCQWTFRLLLCLGYWKEWGYKHQGARIFSN